MFCSTCGAPNSAEAGFCTKCGSPMKTAGVTSTTPAGPLAGPDEPGTANPPATPDSRSSAPVIAVVSLLVIITLLGGAFAAWRFLGIGRTESAISVASTATGAGVASTQVGASSSGAGNSALTPTASYTLLSDHYSRLKTLADGLDFRPNPKAYGQNEGCSGFVFEDGGFNLSIAVKDRATRAALPGKCQEWLDKIAADRAELSAAEVDTSYQNQKDQLLTLYGFLDARVDSMLDAAVIAVDDPQSDLVKKGRARYTRWYKALHPANKTNYQLFEKAYPTARPERL